MCVYMRTNSPRRRLNILVRHDLVELARASGMNVSREVEDFLTYRMGVNSPVDEIQAEINRTEAKLASLKTSLDEVNAHRPSRELKYWKEKYRDLGKSKEVGGGPKAIDRWIKKVAKMLKMNPAELKMILEAEG